VLEKIMDEKPPRIRCDNISYRKGFVEVLENIHPGFVNVETWWVPPQVNASAMALDGMNWVDGQVQANTELELTPAQARELAHSLLVAADLAETAHPV
jgi:hypothetical protein